MMRPAYSHRVIASPKGVAISRYDLTITYAPKSIEHRNIYDDTVTFPHRTASQEIATACGLAMTYSYYLPSAVTDLLLMHFGGSKPPPYIALLHTCPINRNLGLRWGGVWYIL